MTWLPFALAGLVFLVGLAGVVRGRNLVHIAVCLTVCQSSTYVLLLAIGYRNGGTAPIFADIPTSRRTVDPVVQALTLTDIVVSVAVLALLLTLAILAYHRRGTLDPSELTELSG